MAGRCALPISSIPFLSSAVLMATAFALSLKLRPIAGPKVTFPEGIPDNLLKDKLNDKEHAAQQSSAPAEDAGGFH